MHEKTHEPLIHITKRAFLEPWKALIVRICAVFLALLTAGLFIVLLTGLNPLEVYAEMFKGSFSTNRKFWILLQKTAMLLCIALAVTPAFKMKFWNLGAEGQVLAGGLACTACMFYLKDSLPNWLLILIMIAASVLSGIIWAIIPAFFKANWNTNETLFTLMMNYAAIQLVSFCIAKWVPNGSGVLPILNSSTKAGWLPTLFEKQYFLNVLIVAVITVVMYVYLKYSKHGYELSVVGESQNTAKYIGINVKKIILRTVALSGAICGVSGFLLVSGTGHTISTGLAGGNGFTAILVSWLAKFNPFIMVLTSLLISFLQRGASQIASSYQMDDSISDIVTGIILFFIIGCEFFINYKINFRKKEDK